MRHIPIDQFVSALVLMLLLGLSVSAPALAAKVVPQPENSSNTIPISATSTVSSCITVEAVLLSYKPAAMLFGGFVAKNYAVVKTTISNHCADQQFILHDIYFDYRRWALSGVYSGLSLCKSAPSETSASDSQNKSSGDAPPHTGSGTSTRPTGSQTSSTGSGDSTKTAAGPQKSLNQCSVTPSADVYTQGSQPGQVATVGALDVEYQDVEDSEFSPRNKVVKALTLIGAVAQGYAFIGSGGAAMGIGAFNTAFVGSVVKLWPDRRVDQEKYLLSLGYRTDQSTAIAKDGHGSYYAFFPLATFLTPDLKKLFVEDPAVFLNPAEALLENGAGGEGSAQSSKRKKGSTAALGSMLLALTWEIPPKSQIQPAQLLLELSSDCPGNYCPYSGADLTRVEAEKYLFANASLNSVQIVARGVMTIDVNSVPPIIDAVTFEDEKTGASLWTVPAAAAAPADNDAAKSTPKPAAGSAGAGAAPAGADASKAAADQKNLTGEITGKFLSNGTPSIVAIAVPEVKDPQLADYIADKSVEAVSTKSSDTSLAFTLKLGKTTLPSGSKLTFQVSRSAPNGAADASTASSVAGTSTQLTSNKYVYTVSYGPNAGNPTIASVTMENDSKMDVWQTPGKVSGTARGTDLNGGTIAVSALEIGGKTAAVADYMGTIAEIPRTSSATNLDFQLNLVKAVPDGSKVSFVVSTKSGDTTLKSEPQIYTVTKPKVAAAKSPTKKAKASAKANPTR
jgi:hypothetical protein